MSDTTAKQLKKTIKPVYKSNIEKDFYMSLISQFYLQNTDSLEVEKILTELYNSIDSHEITLGEIINCCDKMYLGEIEPNSGVDGIGKLLTANYDKETAINITEELKNMLLSLVWMNF